MKALISSFIILIVWSLVILLLSNNIFDVLAWVLFFIQPYKNVGITYASATDADQFSVEVSLFLVINFTIQLDFYFETTWSIHNF